jgi:retinol dehydrogenase-12
MDQITTHGHDMQFGTNVIGHFYLTQLLLPILIATTESSPDRRVRVVNVSSNGHWAAPSPKKGGPILYDTLVDGPARTKYGDTIGMYFQSKAVSPPKPCTLRRTASTSLLCDLTGQCLVR